ncbi:hypothetical protein [Catellatospora sp. NPDC049609]|uniref:hypothetical protein n=1 Tax=Catellatospora sp. NPDC049609 TaxID=3155505 RepID=UPI00342E765C
MTTELFNLIEVAYAALLAALASGAGVYLATAAIRSDAAADRITAADDLATSRAERIRAEAARSSAWLAPAYRDDTQTFAAIIDKPEHTPTCPDLYYCPTSGEVESGCHGGFDTCCAAPQLHQPGPDAPVEQTTPVVDDLPPVTAADLAPIGPDRMPAVPWWLWLTLPAFAVLALLLMVVVGLVELGAVCRERLAERRDRRTADAVEMTLACPAPAGQYVPRHRAA